MTITLHAIQRGLERIPGMSSEDDVVAVLSSRFIAAAASFGAEYVRLPTGNRVVIANGAIVTVLPAYMPKRTKRIKRAHRRQQGD